MEVLDRFMDANRPFLDFSFRLPYTSIAMTSKTKLTVNAFQRLAKRHGIAPEVLDTIWPPQEETINVDDVEDIAKATSMEVERVALVHFLKDLDKTGYGRFITGRKGYKSRFEWSLDVLQYSSADPTELLVDEAIPEAISHTFVLRKDYKVEIELPADMTEAEAKRLSMFIGSLPFGDQNGD